MSDKGTRDSSSSERSLVTMKYFLMCSSLWIPIAIWRLAHGQELSPIVSPVAGGMIIASLYATRWNLSYAATLALTVCSILASWGMAALIDRLWLLLRTVIQ